MEQPMIGGGGPAPFLLKTYEMVDDSLTDEIVSWSDANNSFVVWNPPEFAARLLPTYFKHNNFSSFIRQLNTYGFRKIDPERWEFQNEEFLKNQKHLLKNIHRRKPIHSHSNPLGSGALGSSGLSDPERIALEEEIDRLAREKATLANDLWRFKQQQSGTKAQLDDFERRLFDIEQRQTKMIDFFEKAVLNPKFVDNLIKIAGSGDADFSNLHKRRRLPSLGLDYCLEGTDNSNFYDNYGSSSSTPKHDAGQVFNQDFSDKLKLGLCPAAISDGTNILGAASTTYSSNERVERSKINGGGLEFRSFAPDSLELKDTGTSGCPMKKSSESIDDADEMILCQLNLTLASSSLQVDKSGTVCKSRGSMPGEDEIGNKEEGNSEREVLKTQSDAAASDHDLKSSAPAGRVNDLFWEKFLTESPGTSDTEDDATRSDPGDDQIEEMKNETSSMLQNRKDIEQLTL